MHGSATTTPAVRAAIQTSGASIRALAGRYGVNPKTVAKWRSRDFVSDAPMGPRARPAPVLTPAEQEMCIAFRKHALLPLDDCLYALQLKIPHLTRATLHRLYRRHGISRLPALEGASRRRIGDFYVNAAPIRTGEGKISMFVAFDRASRFAYAELYEKVGRHTGVRFLEDLIREVPYRIHTVLTSDGPEFAGPTRTPGDPCGGDHPFTALCRRSAIVHELIPAADPWTIGKGATRPRGPAETPGRPRGYRHYEDHAHLRGHFFAFFDSYNFARRLKTLRGCTPYEFICRAWEEAPGSFRLCPRDHMPRLTVRRRSSGREGADRRDTCDGDHIIL